MTLEREAGQMLPAIESELRRQVALMDSARTRVFHEMLAYHMGWSGRAAPRAVAGKRIRPLMVLLAAASVEGRWRKAVPAAAAVEITHNFSLVHDDIQDNSPTRRGRPALWRRYGTALAINAGDALFAMAFRALSDLGGSYPPDVVVEVSRILETACLDLTRGQFLDLYHHDRVRRSIANYWPMVRGKTAALISASTQIGAILGGANRSKAERYRLFGEQLGIAFQVQDDILGIWGDEALTGKSAASDLVEGKLSLPVLYGIRRGGKFARRWAGPTIRPSETARLRQVLKDEGGYDFAARYGHRLTKAALLSLEALKPRGSAGEALKELTQQLLGRRY